MDFRRVEPRFKHMALFVQLALLAGLVAYLVHRISMILVFANEPPIISKMTKWRGAGKWKVCSSFGHIGIGLLNTTGDAVAVSQGLLSGITLTPSSDVNCVIADLEKWEWPAQDTTFFICGDRHIQANIWDQRQNNFKYVHQVYYLESAGVDRMLLQKRRHTDSVGTSDVYTALLQQTYQRAPKVSTWQHNMAYCPTWTTNFATTNPAHEVVAIQFLIQDPLIVESQEQGQLPQLWDLFGSAGGYISLLTLLFHVCFVKKFPESGVAKIYEARTFAAHKFFGEETDSRNDRVPPGMFPGTE